MNKIEIYREQICAFQRGEKRGRDGVGVWD